MPVSRALDTVSNEAAPRLGSGFVCLGRITAGGTWVGLVGGGLASAVLESMEQGEGLAQLVAGDLVVVDVEPLE
jgi:hypothetical protein